MNSSELHEALKQADERTLARVAAACSLTTHMLTQLAKRDLHSEGRAAGFDSVAGWLLREIEAELEACRSPRRRKPDAGPPAGSRRASGTPPRLFQGHGDRGGNPSQHIDSFRRSNP